jgi:hypothetical protein
VTEWLLKTLPHEHHLRNLPLRDVGAFYLARGAKVWREVFPAFGIAKKTFNELSPVWTQHDDWKATKDPLDWDEDRINVIGQNGNDGLHY